MSSRPRRPSSSDVSDFHAATLRLTWPSGLIDNMLWRGRVVPFPPEFPEGHKPLSDRSGDAWIATNIGSHVNSSVRRHEADIVSA